MSLALKPVHPIRPPTGLPGTIRCLAPATLGNFAAGFGLLGAAITPLDGTLLGDVVQVARASEDHFETRGPFASWMPDRARPSLVLHALRLFRERTRQRQPLAVVLDKRVPVNSGLGSSASTIVASLTAFQALHGAPLDFQELFGLACEVERIHSGASNMDNVAASLEGGLRLCLQGRDGTATLHPLPWPEDLVFVVVRPDLQIPTVASRAALPEVVPLGRVLDFAGNLAGLVLALTDGDRDQIRPFMHDPLFERRLASMIPGCRNAKSAALSKGALGCGLSGSGPSLFAVVERDRAEGVAGPMQTALLDEGLACTCWICRLDLEGARLLPS